MNDCRLSLYLLENKHLKKMNMKLTKEQVIGIIRHSLTFVGGLLIMKGIVDEATLTEVTGGVIALVGTIWSIIEKNKA
jgi:hypothetical protein